MRRKNIMNNEEKSLQIIQKEGIFAKIIKFFRKVFINEDKKVDTIFNPDAEERKQNHSETKLDIELWDLIKIQNKLEKIGINYDNAFELTKDLSDNEKKKLIELYKAQIENSENNIRKQRDKILRIKQKYSPNV